MNVRYSHTALSVSDICFDPQLTLIDSAQSFMWRESGGRYYTVLNDSPLRLTPRRDGFLLDPINETEIEYYLHYFDLTRDYSALRQRYRAFPAISEAMELLPGLRVLNQPAWEVLITFILSANNNVERIRKLSWLLCEHMGEGASLDGLVLRAMPRPEVLAAAGEDDLRALGVGYRAPFLIKTARAVRDGFDLDALKDSTYDEALGELITLSGVGEKVANCVLLFGLGHASAFPVDVWVARLMESWFPDIRGLSKSKLARASRELLGPEAGIAQQFLFHCARCNLMAL